MLPDEQEKMNMSKGRHVAIGFGGIAENRVAEEGFACDKDRFGPLKTARLAGTLTNLGYEIYGDRARSPWLRHDVPAFGMRGKAHPHPP